ncbi:MAG: hypothetical protein FRX49_06150 [Trebouxia sp. A1-2]|nr:MAG: hypothetical protein FRX49_06150 [Trebouxia sp. A1-2]
MKYSSAKTDAFNFSTAMAAPTARRGPDPMAPQSKAVSSEKQQEGQRERLRYERHEGLIVAKHGHRKTGINCNHPAEPGQLLGGFLRKGWLDSLQGHTSLADMLAELMMPPC